VWLPASTVSDTSQSKRAAASATSGAPLAAVSQRAQAKSNGSPLSGRPANVSAIALWCTPRTLTPNAPFERIAATIGERRAIATSSRGGSAETDAIALTVSPNRPPGPSVLTTFTPLTAAAIAPTNAARFSGAVIDSFLAMCTAPFQRRAPIAR